MKKRNARQLDLFERAVADALGARMEDAATSVLAELRRGRRKGAVPMRTVRVREHTRRIRDIKRSTR